MVKRRLRKNAKNPFNNPNFVLKDVNNFYKDRVESKLNELINKPFTTEEERDCMAYAIDVLDEILNKRKWEV